MSWFRRRTGPRPEVVSPTGTYTDVHFPPTAAGYDDLGWDVTIRVDPSPDGYFWSHQFGLVGGEQGYVGLQTHNAELGGPIAIFSIWSALDSVGPGWAGPFGGEGTGRTARIPYRWRTDVGYHLSVERDRSVGAATWWHATVRDPTTGVASPIGAIRVPDHWGGITPSTVMWTERYSGPMRRCTDLRHAVADFTSPTTDGGRVVPVRLHDHLADPVTCANSAISTVPGGSRHEMGVGPSPDASAG
jgi:hypothetical protein